MGTPSISARTTRYDSSQNQSSLPWWTAQSITVAAIWSSPKPKPDLENSVVSGMLV